MKRIMPRYVGLAFVVLVAVSAAAPGAFAADRCVLGEYFTWSG